MKRRRVVETISWQRLRSWYRQRGLSWSQSAPAGNSYGGRARRLFWAGPAKQRPVELPSSVLSSNCIPRMHRLEPFKFDRTWEIYDCMWWQLEQLYI